MKPKTFLPAIKKRISKTGKKWVPNKIKNMVINSKTKKEIQRIQLNERKKLSITEIIKAMQKEINSNLIEQKGAKGIIEATTIKEEKTRWIARLNELKKQEKEKRRTAMELKIMVKSEKKHS